MPYMTAVQQAERDELVALLLAEAGTLTEYELDRRLRRVLGLPNLGVSIGGGTGRESLKRLERAGRARCVEEPHQNRYGFRRVWYPVEEGS